MALEKIELPEELLQSGTESSTATSTNRNVPLRYGGPSEDTIREYPILKILDCPICQNRGYIVYSDDSGYLRARDCECMDKRRSLLRLKRSGLEDMIQRYTFDNFQTPESWQVKAKEIAQRYATERKGWFLAAGSVGSGKTHLCTAICASFIGAGIDTRYMLWRDVAVQAKAAITDDGAYAQIVTPLKEVKALYIDDLFKTGKGQAPTAGDVNLAFEILNSRYNDSGKLTIISTELSIEAMLDLDEAVGSRIYERSKGHRLLLVDKPNWRIGDHDEKPI